MKFSIEFLYHQERFSFGDDYEELFKLQGLKPYLPMKDKLEPEYEKVVQGHPKDDIWSYYLYRMLPYDIEKNHLIKYRESIRNAPLGIHWSEEELSEYNSLPDDISKRAMILKKSELKSVYIPHLKYEKEMISYPNLPHDAVSKENFSKGYELFQEEEYEAAYPYLLSASENGNYLATHLLCLVLFSRVDGRRHPEYGDMYYYSKPYFTRFASWYNASKSNKELLAKYESIMEEILSLGRRLEKQGLPVGAYLQAEVYRNYLQNFSTDMFDNRFRSKYVKHLVRAANMGSADACLLLAQENYDLEWALCAMIISHDYRYFDRFAGSFSSYSFEYVSPRNLAIVRLAAMWGSETAMDCLTFGASGNFLTAYKHQILCGFHNGAIYMPNEEELYRRKIYKKYYGSTSDREPGSLIPELDEVFPPRPVIYCPYGTSIGLHYILDGAPVKHPLDKTATEADILAFREHIYRDVFEIEGLYIGGGWAKHVLIPNSIKYKKEAGPFDSREDMIREFPKGTDEFIGYLNAIKLRQLEQNPLYYPSGRPYIYPASVYKKHPDWP